jgi:hypothetical protein
MIAWCLTPALAVFQLYHGVNKLTLVVFQLYHGVNKFYQLDSYQILRNNKHLSIKQSGYMYK